MSEIEDLNCKVLLNELILANIFSHLDLHSFLPLRLVCQTWKEVINPIISEKRKADICEYEPEKNLKYIKSLKISKIKLNLDKDFILNKKAEETAPNLLEEVKKIGPELKYIYFQNIYVSEEVGWDQLRTILEVSPKLETLKIFHFDCAPDFIQALQAFSHPFLKSIRFSSADYDCEDSKELLDTILKCFPNLETNFNHYTTDLNILKIILMEKKPSKIRSWKYCSISNTQFLPVYELLQEVPLQVLSLSKIEFGNLLNCDQEMVNSLTLVFENFAASLKVLRIKCAYINVEKEQNGIVFKIPPLSKLRELLLGIPCLYGELALLTYDLGVNVGKDFPLMEYLVLRKHFWQFGFGKFVKPGDKCFPLTTSWKMWEPFVPLRNDEVLWTLRFLKFVDLGIPKSWVGPEENKDWGKSFLIVYKNLYGNAGQGSIQNLVDWIE